MLTVSEVFYSIQGESTHAGEPCVFVRLTGCDLRCSWCDTEYAFFGGQRRTVEEILSEVLAYKCPSVEITGGEPLLQRDAYSLMAMLLEAGKNVWLETGGHRSIADIPPGVARIVDIKCPSSREAARNNWDNLCHLTRLDEVKFVIGDRGDYEYARHILTEHGLSQKCAAIHFSPVHAVMDLRQLAEWILQDRLPVRLQVQLHKYIWHPDTRGV